MNRNSKPFSVEIKKSRVPGQLSQLPPRRLFAPLPSDPAKALQEETPQAVDEPMAAPRILPSILAPAPDLSEPVSSVRRKRSSIKSDRGQMAFDLNATVASEVGDALPT